ncbi:KTSC domain-containing protein [Salmonella enterica]|nr:KTSC domain-containing protein [Salmonella enterica]EJL9931227.1 KTSC domain-containing protein [Salmonella enterica]ELY5966497.1 KTSC domain-containing protein [Salmonella enterica]
MQRKMVSSSDLRSVGFDPELNVLEIEFNSGGIYMYSGVPEYVYQDLMTASSKGRYFHANIKDKYSTYVIRK